MTDLLTPLRIDGAIPFAAICDETRPVVEWQTHRNIGDFLDKQAELDRYRRKILDVLAGVRWERQQP